MPHHATARPKATTALEGFRSRYPANPLDNLYSKDMYIIAH